MSALSACAPDAACRGVIVQGAGKTLSMRMLSAAFTRSRRSLHAGRRGVDPKGAYGSRAAQIAPTQVAMDQARAIAQRRAPHACRIVAQHLVAPSIARSHGSARSAPSHFAEHLVETVNRGTRRF